MIHIFRFSIPARMEPASPCSWSTPRTWRRTGPIRSFCTDTEALRLPYSRTTSKSNCRWTVQHRGGTVIVWTGVHYFVFFGQRCLSAVCEAPWWDPGCCQHQRRWGVRPHLAQRYPTGLTFWLWQSSVSWLSCVCSGDAGEQTELLWWLPERRRVPDPGEVHHRQPPRHQRGVQRRPACGWGWLLSVSKFSTSSTCNRLLNFTLLGWKYRNTMKKYKKNWIHFRVIL